MAGSSWTNQVVNRLIVAGSGPGTGVFVYDPTAGAGNLIASMTDATTDQLGNTTQPGVTSYNPATGAFARLFGGNVNIQDAGGNPWTISAVTVSGTPYLQLISNLGGSAPLYMDAQGMLHHDLTWTSATPAGSWTNVTGQALEYKLMPDNTVVMQGQLTIPAGVTGAANTFTTVNAAYQPSRNQPVTLTENLAASPFTGTTHVGLIRASGNCDIFGAATNGNTLTVQIRYQLDS
jgi:hypothetical protein